MSRIVGNLLRGWGPLSISGGGTPPNTPTLALADNADGTGAVATISGSSPGSSNAVYTSPVPSGSGALTWSLGGTRTGDGNVSLSLADGYYLAYCLSTLAGLPSEPSNQVSLRTTGGQSARGVAPTGNQGIFLAGVAWLIANSPTFQAIVGQANNPTDAFAHVTFETDDTEESGSSRPRAIVYPASQFDLHKVALQRYRPSGGVWVSFEFPPSNSIEQEATRENRMFDEMLAYCNQVDGIFADIMAIQGTAGGYVSGLSHVALHSISLMEGPAPVFESREEGEAGEVAQYFFGATYLFTFNG